MVAIGITGHRILTEVGRIEAGLDEIVRRLDGAYPESWSVVSALAEGADRLVAHHLLQRKGSRLIAVLPLPRNDYVTDFSTAVSRRDFEQLMSRADEVVEVPPRPSRNEAYEASGLAVLDRSDVLVTVWDGQGAQGRGGTGGIVAEARRRNLPIAWIHAGNRRPNTNEPTSLGPAQGQVSYERFPQARSTRDAGA